MATSAAGFAVGSDGDGEPPPDDGEEPVPEPTASPEPDGPGDPAGDDPGPASRMTATARTATTPTAMATGPTDGPRRP
jgi:hypothetical protein